MKRPASHVEGDIHAAELAHSSVLSTQRAGVVESTEVQREKGCSVDLERPQCDRRGHGKLP